MPKTRIKNGVMQHLLEFSSGSIQILNDDMKQRLSLSYDVLKDKSDNGLLKLPRSTMIVGDGIYNGYWHPNNELKKVFTQFDKQPFLVDHDWKVNGEVGWLEQSQRDGTKYSAIPILNLNTPEGKNALTHIQNRMFAGKPAELSVGFWCTVINEHVKHGDIDQRLPVCRDIEPDHCSLVTRGACSPADGAGVGLKTDNKNLNEGKNMEEENKEKQDDKTQEKAKQDIKNIQGTPEQNADEKIKDGDSKGQDEPITFKSKEDFNDAVHQSFQSYFNKEKELDAEEEAKNKLEDRFKELEKTNKELGDKLKIITDSTPKPQRKTLSNGILEGKSIYKIQRDLQKTINITKHRATMIARTEVIRAYNQASINQYKKVGVTKWKWICAYDDRTCDRCAALDGNVFKMGAQQPPLHVNCRCSLAPIVEKIK